MKLLKNVLEIVPRKQAKFENSVKIFLKCPLWSIAAKLENIWTKIFWQEVDQESCELNVICEILILSLWIVTPSWFLIKISQLLQNVIAFLPERGEDIKTSFDIFGELNGWGFSALLLIFFRFWPSSGGKKGSKLDQMS